MSRRTCLSLMILALLLLSPALNGCGGDEVAPAAESPAAPADTPVPPTATTVPPTETPLPATPTPEPTPRTIDPSTLSLPQDLDTFVLSQFESWDGTGPDGAALAYETDVTAEFVRDPEELHISAVSDDPAAAEALQLMGSADGSMEIYVVGGLLYAPIMGEWMQIPIQVPGTMIQAEEVPFNPTGLMDEAYGEFNHIVQWLESAVYQGQDEMAGMAVERYAFDQSNFNLDRLPPGMVIESAEGQLHVAADDGALIGLEMTVSGLELTLDPKQEEASLAEGTVVYRFRLSAINEPLAIELPMAALLATTLPDDIPVPDDALPAGVFNMMGFQSFSLVTKSPAADVAAFYLEAMLEHGWSEVSVVEEEDYYDLMYAKDDRRVEISIVAESQPGYTGIDIIPSEAES